VGFRSKSGLNGHVIKFHEGKKPFACDVCDEGFLTERSLKFHTSLGHDLNKPIQIKIEPQSEEEEAPVIIEEEIEELPLPENLGMYYWISRIAKIQNRKAKWIEKQKSLNNTSFTENSAQESPWGWGGWTNNNALLACK